MDQLSHMLHEGARCLLGAAAAREQGQHFYVAGLCETALTCAVAAASMNRQEAEAAADPEWRRLFQHFLAELAAEPVSESEPG